MAIPKVMHFIWLGTRPIPDRDVETIRRWCELNPDFTIRFWVDSVGTRHDIIDNYAQERYFKIYMEQGQFFFHDVSKDPGVICPEIRYEIDRFRPNYGAASDLMRYFILAKYGGVYFDGDTLPPAQNLSACELIWGPDAPPHALFMPMSLSENGRPCRAFANDVLICEPNNRIMRLFANMARYNYQVATFPDTDVATLVYSPELADNLVYLKYSALAVVQVYRNDSLSYTRDATLEKTGPVLLLALIRDYLSNLPVSCYTALAESFPTMLHTLECLACELSIEDTDTVTTPILFVQEDQLRIPLEITGSAEGWLGQRIRRFNDRESAIACAVAIVEYGVTHGGGILRIDDMVTHVLESLLHVDGNTEAIIAALLLRLDTIDFAPVRLAQLTFRYPQVIAFYEAQNLMPCTGLFPDSAEELELFQSVISYAYQPFYNAHECVYGFEGREDRNVYRFHNARGAFLVACSTAYRHKIRHDIDGGGYTVGRSELMRECLRLLREELQTVHEGCHGIVECEATMVSCGQQIACLERIDAYLQRVTAYLQCDYFPWSFFAWCRGGPKRNHEDFEGEELPVFHP